jgi:periplasmic divalent cation tolerance protein
MWRGFVQRLDSFPSLGMACGMSGACIVYVTAADAAQALAIGRTLVEERFAACVNVLPGMTSIYRWQGGVERAEEAVLIAKTGADRVAALTARVRALHTYHLPCVVAAPLVDGDPDYLAWVVAESRSSG